MSKENIIEELSSLFQRWGAHQYDEHISQLEHAVQCAQLAKDSGADHQLVVATLLHDVGHLLYLERESGRVDLDIDDTHEATGAAYLARYFGSAVTAPIAMHVEAKRYLCSVEQTYFATLSAGSVRSLEIQGGQMSEAEVKRFKQHPAAERAVALRRWDEQGKSLDPSGLAFTDFLPSLHEALNQHEQNHRN